MVVVVIRIETKKNKRCGLVGISYVNFFGGDNYLLTSTALHCLASQRATTCWEEVCRADCAVYRWHRQ